MNQICNMSPVSLDSTREDSSIKLKDWLGGFLLFCGSLGKFHMVALILFGIHVLLWNREVSFPRTQKQQTVIAGLCIVTLLSCINNWIGIFVGRAVLDSIIPLIPYVLLTVFSIYFINHISIGIWKVFIVLVMFEIVVGFCMRCTGINNLWLSTAIVDTGILYDTKTSGLSMNSSYFGYKVLDIVMLYEFLKINRPEKKLCSRQILYPFALLGLFLSFNRTALITFAAFMGCLLILRKTSCRVKILFVFGIFLGLLLFAINFDYIWMQLFRGDIKNAENALSMRPMIYEYYCTFLKEHIWTGNYSFKLLFKSQILPDENNEAFSDL